jgi:hypothetical protein
VDIAAADRGMATRLGVKAHAEQGVVVLDEIPLWLTVDEWRLFPPN